MFRPCIDLHEGKVKQIVGGSLGDSGLRTNFVSEKPAAWFAELYKRDGLAGGHVIMLGPGNEAEARAALAAFPGRTANRRRYQRAKRARLAGRRRVTRHRHQLGLSAKAAWIGNGLPNWSRPLAKSGSCWI